MAPSEHVQQLDRQIAAAVERAVKGLREQMARRLQMTNDELLRLVEQATADSPGSYLHDEDLAPVATEARTEGRARALQGVRDGAAAIDAATTQAAILEALLDSAAGFASRSALFLTRADGARGWGAHGFGDSAQPIGQTEIDYAADASWAELARGHGGVEMTAADCARLCSRLEVALPGDGVLVPLVLRDRVAAALYADRVGDGPLELPALQVLTQIAALALETLPFRGRSATPTLRLSEAGESPGLALWDPDALENTQAGVAAARVVEARAAASAAPPPPATTTARVAPPRGPEPAPLDVDLDFEPEPPMAEPASLHEAQLAPLEPATADVWTLEEEPVQTPPPPAGNETVAWTLGNQPQEVVPAPPPPVAVPEVTADLHLEEDISDDATVLIQRPRFTEPFAPPPPIPSTQELPVPAPDPDDETQPGRRLSASTTGPLPTPEVRPIWQPSPSPEVMPPADVHGPGFAFGTARIAATGADESLHEEARRLARLLVSEIKLYNEEQVEEGRRARNIYSRLKEDIDRSRQMYEERVDERVRNKTDYFYSELVRILAAGDAKALGI